MAVMLAEFGVRAALATAIADLNNEIGYVETEAATGVDLPRFSSWRAYDSGQASPDEVEFEIFEIGDVTFPHEKYDQSVWRAGQRSRVSCKIPMRAAINHANRGNADGSDATLAAGQMAERSRLYGAALVRTFRNKPDCNQPKFITIVPRALRYNVKDNARVGDEIASLARVEFDFDMNLQEEPTGEQLPNGAALPSVTQEAP